MVAIDVKMTKKAMFDFMLYTSYTSFSGLSGGVFGVITLMLAVRTMMSGNPSAAAPFVLCTILFLVAIPMQMKMRANEQVLRTPMFQKPIHYELTEEGVKVSQDGASAVNAWEDFRKAVSTGQSVILYITKARAIILPKESIGEDYQAVVKMISTHMPPKKVKIRHVSA